MNFKSFKKLCGFPEIFFVIPIVIRKTYEESLDRNKKNIKKNSNSK